MAMLEGFRIQNYRVLRDVTFGKLWNTQHTSPPPYASARNEAEAAVIGKNGVTFGKSTVFDVIGLDFLDFLPTPSRLGSRKPAIPTGAVGFIGFARRDIPSRSDSRSTTGRTPELVRLPTSYRSTKSGGDRLSRRKDSGSEEKDRVGDDHFPFFTLRMAEVWPGQVRMLCC